MSKQSSKQIVLINKQEARRLGLLWVKIGGPNGRYDDQECTVFGQKHHSYSLSRAQIEKLKLSSKRKKGVRISSKKYGERRAFASSKQKSEQNKSKLGPREITEISKEIDEAIKKSKVEKTLPAYDVAKAIKKSLKEAIKRAEERVATLEIVRNRKPGEAEGAEIIERVEGPRGRSEQKTIRPD